MDLLEQDLEDIIYNAPRKELEERGLYIEGTIKRQLRIGNYGTADLVTFTKYPKDIVDYRIKVTIYELKKGKIGTDAFMQGIRYIKGIQDYLGRYRHLKYAYYELVLIGGKVDTNSSFLYLIDLLSWGSFALKVCTYEYSYDGIRFSSHFGYKLVESGFSHE